MKKIIYFLVMFPLCVNAAQQCVTLDSSGETCASDYGSFSFQADWDATCPNSNGTPVRGFGVCATTSATLRGDVMDDLEFSADEEFGNEHCWCKMVSPAVSRWVYYGWIPVAGCARECAYYCGNGFTPLDNSAVRYRQALFSNLKD